jgi:S-adenosyl-L-methionine hydrolase (adenosine-forming)
LIAYCVREKKAGFVPAFSFGAGVIVLFTDFGSSDPYVGQVKAALHRAAPRVSVVDALNDAPQFAVEPAAHLLAALVPHFGRGSVFLAVVDPGVGGPRDAIVVDADGQSFVGPDNGLLSVVWQRATRRRSRRIVWRPVSLSSSFHGRDLFAPVAAALARGRVPAGWLAAPRPPRVLFKPTDFARVIYVDHFGNAMTGLRAANVAPGARLRVGRRVLSRAVTFGEARSGAAFWYVNSLGLLEIAANGVSAASKLRMRIGTPVVLSRD